MSITRSEVIRRAATVWPLGHVPYSQMTVRNPGWRTDCSGYVSMCLDLAKPGLSTVTLVTDGYIHEISPNELRAGDLVGHCGPGTGGDEGHVVLFDHWERGHETYWAYEFHGGMDLGPEHSLINYPYHGLDGYKAYRYKEILDGPHGEPGGHWVSVTAWPDAMSTISGIAAHSGITDWHALWDDPHNAGLRAHRVTPEHVQLGDAVWVPAPS
jgi:hypothetical protein